MLVCDWLLETRTAIWEDQGGTTQGPVSNKQLTGFQSDLSSLSRIAQDLPVSVKEANKLMLKIISDH